MSFRGSLRYPALPGGGLPGAAPYASVRLLAGLYELREGDAVRQINQPVEIAQVDSVGSAAGEELGAGIGTRTGGCCCL